RKLAARYIRYYKKIHSFNESRECKVNDGIGSESGECCTVHYSLLTEGQTLKMIAEGIPMESSKAIFSEAWWRDLGRKDIADMIVRRRERYYIEKNMSNDF